jgi:hypothetical protein
MTPRNETALAERRFVENNAEQFSLLGLHATGMHVCTKCPPGCRYNGMDYLTAVTKDSSGSWFRGRAPRVCVDCEAARFSLGGVTACASCDAGRAQNGTAAMSCNVCEPGRFAKDGALECVDCSPGTYSPLAEYGAHRCSLCTPGRYAPRDAMYSCLNCHVGRASSSEGSSCCEECSIGKSTLGAHGLRE